MKTNKSVSSKIRLSANGKLKMNKPGRRHLLTKKTSKRKRHLQRKLVLSNSQGKSYLKRMGKIG